LELARKTGLHRSYIYDAVERLMDGGIVTSVMVESKKHFQAVDPKVLREIFELKLRNLDSVLPNLSSIFHSTREETNVELHKGKKVFQTLIKEIISNAKTSDEICLYGVDENILEMVEPIYLKKYFAIIREKKIKEKIIIPRGGKRFREPNLEYRELEKKFLGNAVTVLHNSKVFIFIKGSPNYLISIMNQKIAESFRSQFAFLWKNAKPVQH
jgi:sugar-specific transcriptional regulator TrmB